MIMILFLLIKIPERLFEQPCNLFFLLENWEYACGMQQILAVLNIEKQRNAASWLTLPEITKTRIPDERCADFLNASEGNGKPSKP